MKSIAEMEKLIENFDKFSYYLNDKLERDIEENRKGRFVIRIRNKRSRRCNGNGKTAYA